MAVPDVAQLSAPGERLQVVSKIDSHNPTDGVTGLKALGVRELTYRLVFLASSILSADTHEGFANIRDDSEDVRGKPPTGGTVIPGEQGRRGREPTRRWEERKHLGGTGGTSATAACDAGKAVGAHIAHASSSRHRAAAALSFYRRSSSPCRRLTRIRLTR